MLVVRTADKSEAWRCRIAMFTGIAKTVTVNGVEINGIVRSIKQRLYTLDEDATVVTGHGPDTRLGDEMRENPFVRA